VREGEGSRRRLKGEARRVAYIILRNNQIIGLEEIRRGRGLLY
jgi:hypothetical protein